MIIPDDTQEFVMWASQQTPEIGTAVAAQTALRTFPFLSYLEWTLEHGAQITLQSFRCVLAAANHAVHQTSKTANASISAAKALEACPLPNDSISFDAHDVMEVMVATARSPKNLSRTIQTVRLANEICQKWARRVGRSCSFSLHIPDQDADAIITFKQPLTGFDRLMKIAPGGTAGEVFHKQLFDCAEWSFWSRWYDRAMAGDPLPWHLQREVALIPDEIWEQGPEAVAERIAEIEADFEARRAMTTEALRQQARSLLATPRVAEAGSRDLAQRIALAIREYNRLPDGLDSLEKLPGIFHEIAEVLASERPHSEREAQLMKLIGLMSRTVNRLNDRLADANAVRAAEMARGDRPSNAELRRQGFHTRTGEQASEAFFGLLSKGLWGAVGLGIGTFLGADGAAQAERLMGCTDTMIEQLAPDAMPYEFMPLERPAYPPATEV